MTKPRKVQTMLLVDPPVRDRADVLALALDEIRAEIYRVALSIALPQLEAEHAHVLKEIDAIAKALGMDRYELARSAKEERHTLADVREIGARLTA